MHRLLLLFCAIGIASSFAEEGPGYSWKHCERADFGDVTIPFAPDGTFKPECAPDTLYSWQDRVKLQLFFPFSDAAVRAINFRFLYAWRTPWLSSPYGSALLRIKLKPGVRFVAINEYPSPDARNCHSGESGTIHVGYRSVGAESYSEYILCSPDVVESWSVDTREALAEIDRERAWIGSHASDDYDSYVRRTDLDVIAAHLPAEETEPKLASLRELAGDGRIFYAPGVPEDRARHFATKQPGYFNPNADTGEAAR